MIPSSTSANKIKIKISDSTESADCSNISIPGFYLLKEAILLGFLWLSQEPCKKFVSGKIIYLMTTDAKAFPN